MAKIKLTCPLCGEVDLTAAQIRLQVRRDAAGSSYGFECPTCRKTVVKPATARMLGILKRQGVGVDPGDRPPDPSAPPIGHDELLEFHFALQSDETIAAFLAASADPTAGDRDAVR